MHSELTRAKMKRLAEDMLGGSERRREAEQRIRSERFAVMMWLTRNELTLQRGEDLVDLDARWGTENDKHPLETVRGISYFFDVCCQGRRVGHGYVCWHSGHERPFRELDWHLFTKGGDTYELGEEVWRRARLDRQLPRQFRRGYRSHPQKVLDAIDKEYELDECG